MSPTNPRLSELKERAALRNLGIRSAPEPPYGFELDNAHSVLVSGSLDEIDEWLTRTDRGPRP